jgi:CelD/BcsL family acetyltransferase involved in cellulose biosynthesis
VYELYFGNQLAASRLCILNGRMLIVLKTTYDETLAHFAPGRVLLHMLLEREFESKDVSRIEFYTNANADSLSWATASRDIFHVAHFRFGLLRRLVSGSRPWRQALRDRLSSTRETPAPQSEGNDLE